MNASQEQKKILKTKRQWSGCLWKAERCLLNLSNEAGTNPQDLLAEERCCVSRLSAANCIVRTDRCRKNRVGYSSGLWFYFFFPWIAWQKDWLIQEVPKLHLAMSTSFTEWKQRAVKSQREWKVQNFGRLLLNPLDWDSWSCIIWVLTSVNHGIFLFRKHSYLL